MSPPTIGFGVQSFPGEGGFGVAPLMSDAGSRPADKAEASMRLLSGEVMPNFRNHHER